MTTQNKSFRPSRALALLLALGMTFSLLPPAQAAELETRTGTVYTVGANDDIATVMERASEGDTIRFCNGYTVNFPGNQNDDPWVINKRVTITGGPLFLRTSGIILGADVTFEEIELSFGHTLRNAIMANGHTLTLKNVSCADSGLPVNLFCGGLVNGNTATMPASGGHGKIQLLGSVSLRNNHGGVGDLYAGNLCMGKAFVDGHVEDGPENSFGIGSEIIIASEGDAKNLGAVYACGAQQRIGQSVGNDGVQSEPIKPDYKKYKTSDNVSVVVQGTGVSVINGRTGSSMCNAAVLIERNSDYLYEPTLTDIESLTVQRGNVQPSMDSTFRTESAALTVAPGATLNLSALPDTLTVGNFTGGGTLVLGDREPALTINGTVNKDTTATATKVVISSPYLQEGKTYIQAAYSTPGDFELVPPNNQPTMVLERDNSGNWKTKKNGEPIIWVKSLQMEDVTVPSSETSADMPFTVTYEDGSQLKYLDYPQLTLSVNGQEMKKPENPGENIGFVYVSETGNLEIEVFEDYKALEIRTTGGTAFTDNSYKIQAVIPAVYTKNTAEIQCEATLFLTADGTLAAIDIPSPESGLVYNGEAQTGVKVGQGYTLSGTVSATNAGDYEAVAELKPGYCWKSADAEDTENKTISWSIAPAPAAAAPAGLAAVPATKDKNDGKITGVSIAMEYARDESFTQPVACQGTEITGLAAGTYYVRVKGDSNHTAPGERVEVIVPVKPYVTKIEISSTDHKTAYTVGDALDVSKLIIKATLSDQSVQHIAVTADMVSGFHAEGAAEAQELTITYEGATVSYIISISAATVTPPETEQPTVSSITINSTNHKTEYTVGDPLDVTGLTIEASMSDRTKKTVPVTAAMVTGFNSANPAESLPLTITYEGKATAYTVKISPKSTDPGTNPPTDPDEPNQPADPAAQYKVTVTGSYAAATGAGTYAQDASVTVRAGSRSGYTFEKWTAAGLTLSTADSAKADLTFTMPAADVTLTAQWKEAANTYNIYLEESDRGYLTTDKITAAEGVRVTIRAYPDSGYRLRDLWITDRWGDPVDYRETAENRYTFTMPASRVDVEAEFTRISSGSSSSGSGGSHSSSSSSTGSSDTRTPAPAPAISAPAAAQAAPRAPAAEQVFRDIPTSHWAAGEIAWAKQRGYMNGTGNGAFQPGGTVSNQQLWMVLARVFGNSPANMTEATAWARKNGLATGRNPNGQMTRQEMVTVLYRSAFLLGADTSPKANLTGFRDAGAVSSSSQDAMAWALASGILNGDAQKRLNPNGTVTRAEFSVILYRFCSRTGR